MSKAEIAAIEDADARENWQFPARLARAAAGGADAGRRPMLRIIREGASGIPPLFLDQLVQVILRSALDEVEDPFVVRAAECSRSWPQRVTAQDDTILLADAEIIEGHEADRHALAAARHARRRGRDLARHPKTSQRRSILRQRSDGFDMVLDLSGKLQAEQR